MKRLLSIALLSLLLSAPAWANNAGPDLRGTASGGGTNITAGAGDLSACTQTGASLNCTVTKTNGSSFATSATTDTTNATNITTGSLGTARLSAYAQAIIANAAMTNAGGL